MPTSGENAVREIQADLACPQCQYNLRGLRGEIVTCPECGCVCDVAKLISTRWEKPWWAAPMFNLLALPVAWAFAALVIGTILMVLADDARYSRGAVASLYVGLLGLAAVWAGLIYYVGRWRFGSWQGVRLSLLAHGLVAGYTVGTVGAIASVVRFFVALSELSGPRGRASVALLQMVISVLILTVLIAVIYVCQRGERYMAQQCIRRYLAQQTAVSS